MQSVRCAIAVLLVGCGAGRQERAEPRPPAARQAAIEGDADDPDTPCDALAQAYCEALTLRCDRVRAVIVAAAIEGSRCEAIASELAELRSGSGPDVHAAAAAESLQRLLAGSSLTPHEVDAILAGEGSGAEAAEAEVLACPAGTVAKGEAGDRMWCEGSDGLPHGPFTAWNGRGEIVQRGTYDRGRLVDPGYVVPESRDIQSDAFACPHGTAARTRVDGPERARWCERPNGTWHGPALVWRDGLVTRFAVWDEGRETRAFAVAP